MPAWLLPMAAAIAPAAIDAFSTSYNNNQQKEHNLAMYRMQQRDAVKQWHLSNEYNHPRAQMQRLQQAGLNPNLVYGTGSATGGTASPASTPNATPARLEKFNTASSLVNGLQTYQSVQQSNAQKILTETQTANVAADTANKAIEADAKGFELGKAKELRQVALDTSWEQLRRYQLENAYIKPKGDATIEQMAESLKQTKLQNANTAAEKARIEASTTNINLDNAVRKINLELQRNHINPNDPMYQRIIGSILNNIIDGTAVDKAIEMAKKYWKMK